MHIWVVDKSSFLQQYRDEKHTAEEFDYLIINYSNLANSVQVQETVNQVRFIEIDSDGDFFKYDNIGKSESLRDTGKLLWIIS